APVISPDGRYVAFQTSTSQLPRPFPNANMAQVFVRDLQSGTTSLVSVATNGTSGGDRDSSGPIFAADSHHLVFVSTSDNLVSVVAWPNPYAWRNVFERDLTTGTTQLVTRNLAGTGDGDGDTHTTAGLPAVSVSADGRFVAFHSDARNLVATDPTGAGDVF